MLIFGGGMSTGPSAEAAAREATAQARRSFGETTPKLALVFASMSYADIADTARAVREVAGSDVQIVGGSSGACVLGPQGVASHGVSVVLLGGDDLLVTARAIQVKGPELVEIVPATQEIAHAADEAAKAGFEHHVCLVFAPAIDVDGEALVAAIRKGAGTRAQLAGGLIGNEMLPERQCVFFGDELHNDKVIVTGVFTRKPVGIAGRHGLRPVGPIRTVTRADGPVLYELDRRPAAKVWLEDARRAGATLPKEASALASFLAYHYQLGMADSPNSETQGAELVVRAPYAIQHDGSVTLSGSIGEGRRVRVMNASRKDLLRGSASAAADAVMRAGGHVAGALVLACSARFVALGDEFTEETTLIHDRVAAPIGGACVYGEIAKSERDVDAFFNTTVVVVAFGA